jgi:PEP-CTERM motif
MRDLKLTILLCGLIWLCCGSTQVFGSQVVTSGYICCLAPETLYLAASFELTGVGFDATGIFGDLADAPHWAVGDCVACQPGTLLGVWGNTGGEDFGGGTATIGSTYYSDIGWFNANQPNLYSYFNVTGPPILLTGPGTFHGTFSFTGFLCGSYPDTDTTCRVDLPNLTGSGIVTVEVVADVDANGDPALEVTSAGYTFTPEPASLLLFGSGALGLAGMLRRKLML